MQLSDFKALTFDVYGTFNHFDLTCCHIYRRHDQDGFGATMTPGEMPVYQYRFNSMADLVKAHEAEQ